MNNLNTSKSQKVGGQMMKTLTDLNLLRQVTGGATKVVASRTPSNSKTCCKS